MEFDVVLPISVFITVLIIVFSYGKFEGEAKLIFGDRKFRVHEIVFMIILMGIFVSLLAVAPEIAIQVLFIAVYSVMMFSFVYSILKRIYLAVFPPFIFTSLYLLYPSVLASNLFAIVFAIIVSVYLGVLFSWKTTLLFAVLLTIIDVTHVFVTGFMIQAAEKMVGLQLPVAVILSAYPSSRGVILGLGDIVLSGLLTIQTTVKYGKKEGVLSAFTIGIAIFTFEYLIFNNLIGGIQVFPATIVVILGWILSIGVISSTRRTFQSSIAVIR